MQCQMQPKCAFSGIITYNQREVCDLFISTYLVVEM